MRLDFTIVKYKQLLLTLQSNGYLFQTFHEFLKNPQDKAIILRHDIDRLPQNALRVAQIEHELDIKGTYYFRIVPESFEPKIIEKIASLGHEIGYHYEDLHLAYKKIKNSQPVTQLVNRSEAKADNPQQIFALAIELFEKHLEQFRKYYPIQTICMHGSPLSKYNNKLLWKYYDYRDYEIIGEPYFDVDYSKVLYITDTGRKWNNQSVSVRDKIDQKIGVGKGEKQHKNLQDQYSFRNTYDIIKAVEKKALPNTIMINAHPHRWFYNYWGWTKELVMQNLKNIIKRLIVKYRN